MAKTSATAVTRPARRQLVRTCPPSKRRSAEPPRRSPPSPEALPRSASAAPRGSALHPDAPLPGPVVAQRVRQRGGELLRVVADDYPLAAGVHPIGVQHVLGRADG